MFPAVLKLLYSTKVEGFSCVYNHLKASYYGQASLKLNPKMLCPISDIVLK